MSSEETPIANCTPFEIIIVDDDNKELVRLPSEGVVRVCSMQQRLRTPLWNAVPVISRPKFVGIDDPDGLLQRYERVIVSTAVAQYLADSVHLIGDKVQAVYTCDTGPQSAVRDENGLIMAIKRLVEW